MCFNEHIATHFKSTRKCIDCGERHHSLMHLDTREAKYISNTKNLPERPQVLISTVEMLIQDINGFYHKSRALLDSVSECSYMIKNFQNQIGVVWQKFHLAVGGIAGVKIPTIISQSDSTLALA